MSNSTNISRKSFLAGIPVVGGAMALGATSASAEEAAGAAQETSIPFAEKLWECLPAEELGVEVDIAFVAEKIPDDQIVREEEYDFVVVGAGMAGASTAASAAESGNKVALLEKLSTYSCRGHQIGCLNSRYHKAAGVVIDPNEVVAAVLQTVGFRAKQSLWERYVKNCDEAVEWLLDLLDGYAGEPWLMFPNGNVQTATTTWWCSAIIFEIPEFPKVVEGLINHAVANGCDVFYNSPAAQLVQDADGKVTGVIARTAEGYVKFNSKKGVALCTGGYEFNSERMRKYMRPRDLALSTWLGGTSTIGATGDGQEMGLAAGGIEDEYPHLIMTDPSVFMTWPRVNYNGERFVSEYSPFNYIANAIQHQPGAFCYVIGDDDAQTSAERMWNETHVQGTPEFWYERFKDCDIQSDTLEGLAEQMGVPVDTFVATVARYNELGDKGVDEDFNNPPEFLCPIKKAPFYAIRDSTAGLTTVSGLRISDHSEVLNGETFQPIPGLYAGVTARATCTPTPIRTM